ncbi:MAG: Rpn family recombination-promoting nuclease/putative transposase, partial [Eubacteriales bacterium]
KEIKHNHQVTKPKMTSGEFLGSFRKSDKLTPIITIVVYYGEEPWDGPHCLLDMMKDIPEEIKEVVSDYQMNLLQILHEDSSKFRNKEIRQAMEYSQAFMARDKEKVDALTKQGCVSKDTAYMIGSITKSKKLMTTLMKEEETGEVDMCKFFQDIMDEGRREMRWEAIQNIMDSLDISTNEAMDILKIPHEEREQYMELV